MAGPGTNGLPARGAATLEMAQHHRKVMLLYAMGKRYSEIARLTGYRWSTVRKIVEKNLAKRVMSDETAAECRSILSTKLDLMMERLEEELFQSELEPMDDKLLDKYLKTISLRAVISLPRMPSRVDVSVAGPPTGAIEFGHDLQRFMNMADIVVANRLGSGRSPEEVIDVQSSEESLLEPPAPGSPLPAIG